MECLFGFVGDGFALVVADTCANQSIVVQKTTEDKITCLDSHKLLGCIGESGDRVQFSNFIQKNMNLYHFRNGIPLSTSAAASFTRCELATALRKAPYQVNMMMAGYDKRTGPCLFYLDYIATLQKLNKGAQGFGAYFILSLFDKYYQKNMNVEEALQLVDKCIWEIGTRMVASPANYVIKIVDRNGARLLARRGRPEPAEEQEDLMQ
uniref:Proteasome subunit beta n=1 Tax=Physcomitrium patens TaxID=3218 RepID=A9TEE1_PHYPA|nr:hypothetical protein PHYPA_012223 [Physcomitrium patens]